MSTRRDLSPTIEKTRTRPRPGITAGPDEYVLARDADDGRMREDHDTCRTHDDRSIEVAMNRRLVDACGGCGPQQNRLHDITVDRRTDVRDTPRRRHHDLAHHRSPHRRNGNLAEPFMAEEAARTTPADAATNDDRLLDAPRHRRDLFVSPARRSHEDARTSHAVHGSRNDRAPAPRPHHNRNGIISDNR